MDTLSLSVIIGIGTRPDCNDRVAVSKHQPTLSIQTGPEGRVFKKVIMPCLAQETAVYPQHHPFTKELNARH